MKTKEELYYEEMDETDDFFSMITDEEKKELDIQDFRFKLELYNRLTDEEKKQLYTECEELGLNFEQELDRMNNIINLRDEIYKFEIGISEMTEEKINEQKKILDYDGVDAIMNRDTMILNSVEDVVKGNNVFIAQMSSKINYTAKIDNEKNIDYLLENYEQVQKLDIPICLQLSDMSVVSEQKLNELNEKIKIEKIFLPNRVKEYEHGPYVIPERYKYDFEDYIEMKESFDWIIDDIEEILEEKDSIAEVDKFLQSYKHLGSILEYDFDDNGDGNNREEAHNLMGVLLESTGTCEGYALLLEQVSKYFGIDCKTISNGEHAWNQVKINDKWYNCDLTWDSTRIKDYCELDYCLQSDEDFINHPIEECIRGVKVEKCPESFDREYINKDIIEKQWIFKIYNNFLDGFFNYTVTAQDIGKATINAPTQVKQEAGRVEEENMRAEDKINEGESLDDN